MEGQLEITGGLTLALFKGEFYQKIEGPQISDHQGWLKTKMG